jgi:hypothetical protein
MHNQTILKPVQRIARLALALAVLILLGSSVAAQAASQQQSPGIVLIGPAGCPANGCAAGQRLSYRLEFELGQYNPADTNPNVKVCLYYPDKPTSWHDSAFSAAFPPLDATGGITGSTYTPAATCPEDSAPPTNYILASAGAAAFNNINVFHDTLGFNFRISTTATTPGSILMRVFEQTGDPATPVWKRTQQVFTPLISIVPPTNSLYVANDAAACPAGSVCYLNSAGDLNDGIGTGLKDAIDAAPADGKITFVGSSAVKDKTVLVNKKLTLEGSADASIVSSGTACNSPMLAFTRGGTVRNLNISDSSCTSTHRGLIAVNTNADLIVEMSDLLGGADAIHVFDNTGNLILRYNNIQGSSGYALFWEPSSGAAGLSMIANNVISTRSGSPIECATGATGVAANRRANHNFWGGPTIPANSHCVIDAGKQLGAAILSNPSAPGVNVERDTVTTAKTYHFAGLIALQRGAGGADYDVYVINHGPDSPSAIPFTGASYRSPYLCSNAWDLFIADGQSPGANLELFLKYNRSAACITAIESSQFCSQTATPAKYPLWWLDPSGAITNGWNTTGQNPDGANANSAAGQTTTCDMANDEIHVSIGNSGRPALNADLNFTPFLVGIRIPSSFRVLASDKTITVSWSTSSEPDITGFYVLRSLAAAGPFDPISDLITKKGSALAGSSYVFSDTGRTNGTTNYYRVKVVRTDGGFFYSDTLSIVPNVATVTPTSTPSRTWTPYPSITPYRSSTPYYVFPSATRYSTPTRLFLTSTSVSSLRTRTPTPLNGLTRTNILTSNPLTPSATFNGTQNPSANGTGYPAPGSSNALSPTPSWMGSSGTATVTRNATTSLTSTPNRGDKIRNASDWISMVMGFMMSTVVVASMAWLIFFRKKTPLS